MKASAITLGMVLLSTAAGATTAFVCKPDPLLEAQTVAFSFFIGETMSMLAKQERSLLWKRPEERAMSRITRHRKQVIDRRTVVKNRLRSLLVELVQQETMEIPM